MDLWLIAACALGIGEIRPITKSHMKMPPQIRTGATALIGKQAIVLEPIINDEGVGCVKIDGEVSTARSLRTSRRSRALAQ